MNYRETVGTQIKFEFQERERRLAKLMGREQSTRSVTPTQGWIGKLVTWFGSSSGNRTESLSPRLEAEWERPLMSLQDHEAAS